MCVHAQSCLTLCDPMDVTRQFKKNTGKTPIKALIEMRIEKATDLVANTDIKICDIAAMCGYNTASFFISEYKKNKLADFETGNKKPY